MYNILETLYRRVWLSVSIVAAWVGGRFWIAWRSAAASAWNGVCRLEWGRRRRICVEVFVVGS